MTSRGVVARVASTEWGGTEGGVGGVYHPQTPPRLSSLITNRLAVINLDHVQILRLRQRNRVIGRLHINISGCINACGHHHVGHIGILGVEKNGQEFYQVTIGGRADESAALGTLIGPAVPYDQVADVVEDIVEAYLALRERPDELFIDVVKRLGVTPFKERVYATR